MTGSTAVSNATDDIELDLLLEALYRFCGYDLRGYSRPSLKRLAYGVLMSHNLKHISELIPKLAHDEGLRAEIIDGLTVSYSILYRDPEMFNRVRQDVFSYLKSFPRLSIWVAGCADGEEVYSLAVLLAENGLLGRTRLYATDINQTALENASSGILQRPLDQGCIERYRASGGQCDLMDYFDQTAEGMRLKPELLKQITFTRHNLVQQACHVSAHMILCRNVFIYFDHDLKEHVLSKLAGALIEEGYLAIGLEESISLCDSYARFDILSRKASLFRKKASV